jgi:serine phosphatase RsbU (regulator of sigma subunit)
MKMQSECTCDTKASSKFHTRLHSALHRLVEPIALYAHYSLGIMHNGNTDWLCQHDNCNCARESNYSNSMDNISLLPISRPGQPACQVILCTKGGQTSLLSIVCSLVKEAADQVDMEFEDENLILELGTSWESLHTLYEISSDFRTSRDIQDILGKILDRITAGRKNLIAVLWIEKDGSLEPATALQTKTFEPRGMNQGLFGRAIASRMPIVINDRSKIPLSLNLEPELANACRLALVPIATRERLAGLLEIWQEDGSEEFDTQIIGLFEALALQAAMVLEGERAYHISLAEAKLRKEFEIGGKIQEMLLSGRPPTALPGIKIGVFTEPSREIDGDFFDFISSGNECLDIFIGDVMGKGIPAALVGAEAKSDLLRAFGQLTAANRARQLPAPKDIVTFVHEHFTSQLIDIESFISLYYVRFNLRRKQLDFVDCGHPRAIHYRADTKTLGLLSGDNMPLGVLEGGTYSQASVSFNPNDIFLFYSDGVTDACNSGGLYFGEDRLVDCLQKNTHLHPTDLCLKIREAVAEFTGTSSVTDDFTCLAVKIEANDVN